MKPGTITLPRDLVLTLIRMAYWPTVRAETDRTEPDPTRAMSLAEARCLELDEWIVRIGCAVPDEGRTPQGMLTALLIAWDAGDRP